MRRQNLHIYTALTVCVIAAALCATYAVYVQKEQPAYISIIPHHDMVASMRKAFLMSTYHRTGSTVRHVIILSPNHFGTGPFPITTTSHVRHAGNDLPISSYLDLLEIPLYSSSFAYEHGITNVLGDLMATFPHADFVPIIVKNTTSQNRLKNLAYRIEATCSIDCVVIGSIDFSHEKTVAEAQTLDDVTEHLLATIKPDELLRTGEADSPEILYILASLAQKRGLAWHTFARTHSGALLGDPHSRETTSHILGTYSADK